MKALILAGGRGKRLDPMTTLLPKALLPVGGAPVLGTIFEALAAEDVREVCVVTCHLGEVVRRFAGDGSRWGLSVTFVDQGTPRGTGDAVIKAAGFIDDAVMVIAADTAFDRGHIAGTAALFRQRAPDCALCLKRMTPETISRVSSVRLGEDDRILELVEKPAPGHEPSLLSAGLLHVYAPLLRDYLPRLRETSRGEIELTEATAMMIAEAGRTVVGREFPTPPDLTDHADFLRHNFPYTASLLAG